jgi:hypothetical protein
MMTNNYHPPSVYIERGDLTSKQTTLINLDPKEGVMTHVMGHLPLV